MNSESEQSLKTCIGIFLFVCWTVAISFIWLNEGRTIGYKACQKEAVLKGAAEYVVDESGNPVFQWKEGK